MASVAPSFTKIQLLIIFCGPPCTVLFSPTRLKYVENRSNFLVRASTAPIFTKLGFVLCHYVEMFCTNLPDRPVNIESTRVNPLAPFTETIFLKLTRQLCVVATPIDATSL